MVVKVLTGNYAVAEGVRLSKVKVISAYPITPQTTIVEKLSEYVESGIINAKLIRVESEHSALAAVYGAAIAGVRAFTATSSHGLLYMHEMLWWVAGSRVPLVMAVVTRTIGAPWNIWNDYSDFMDQRDTGWLMVMAENNQEILDTVIQLFRITEDPQVYLPGMLGLDGFLLSHTSEPVDIPDDYIINSFLPQRSQPYVMRGGDVLIMGNIPKARDNMLMRYDMNISMNNAKRVINDVDREYSKLTGRSYGGLIECYRCEDSKYLLVGMGAWVGNMRDACDDMRDQGYKVGVLKVRFFRPFPADEVRDVLKGVRGALIFDRSTSLGSLGHLHTEVLAHTSELSGKVVVKGVVAGLAGVDVDVSDIKNVALRFIKEVEENSFISNISEWYFG